MTFKFSTLKQEYAKLLSRCICRVNNDEDSAVYIKYYFYLQFRTSYVMMFSYLRL